MRRHRAEASYPVVRDFRALAVLAVVVILGT
jgi:hypothetical protein